MDNNQFESKNVAVPASKRFKKPLFFAIVACITALTVALFLFYLLGGRGARSPEQLAQKYISSYEESDGESLLALSPKKVVRETFGDKQAQSEYIQEFNDDTRNMITENNLKIEYVGVKEISTDQRDEIIAFYKETYDLKVKDVKVVVIRTTMDMEGFENGQDLEMRVIKIGLKWYLGTQLI